MSKKTDHWMPLVIGSYLRDTQHLDAERHGCYLLWLMHYWIKGPLPNSVADLVLIGKLRSPDAWSIAQALLGEFFTLEDDNLYHQKRADAEKDRWNGKQQTAQEKAAKAAHARWKPRVPKDAPSNAPRNAWRNAQAMLGRCPTPTPVIQELKLLSPEATQSTLRPEEFGNAWNQTAGKVLPRIKEFTDSRRKKVLLRMKQGLALDKFAEAVKACTEKPFLRGDGPRHWKATFDWLMQNDRNIERVFEEDWAVTGGVNGRSTAQSKQDATVANVKKAVARIRGVDTSGIGQDRSSDGSGDQRGAAVIDMRRTN
jgi:uncharacterized protein YdaU (DUF1376 family)